MTTRHTISFPDDVALAMNGLPGGQVSVYVTEAVRRRIQSDAARVALRAAGRREFPFDPVAAAGRLAGAAVPAEVRQAAIDRLAVSVGDDRDELAARLDRSAESAGW
jgi:hypothetical protein